MLTIPLSNRNTVEVSVSATAVHFSGNLSSVGRSAVEGGPPARASCPQHHASPLLHTHTLWNLPRDTCGEKCSKILLFIHSESFFSLLFMENITFYSRQLLKISLLRGLQ